MIWNYDIMMHGTWDANAFNTLNDTALTEISKFIDAGRGVLSGHDTIGSIFGKKNGISKLAEKFNIIRGAEGNAADNRI